MAILAQEQDRLGGLIHDSGAEYLVATARTAARASAVVAPGAFFTKTRLSWQAAKLASKAWFSATISSYGPVSLDSTGTVLPSFRWSALATSL